MRKMGIVLKFELKEYFSSKGFMGFTILMALLSAVLLCLPRFVDMSDFTGVPVNGKETASGEEAEGEKAAGEQEDIYLYADLAQVIQEDVLGEMFPGVSWQKVSGREEVMERVESQETEAGFVVTGPAEYEYYVYNKAMSDSNTAVFDQVMKQLYRMDYCSKNGLNLEEISSMYDVPVTVTEQILNKDTGSNYWYCYFLVIIVFMLIMMYGQMIAVSVTNEKSNRAIEVLVTSTSSNSLLFGKVIAGAVGGLFQAGVVLGAVLTAYQLNRQQWGGMLDMFFHVPGPVLATFAVFGLGGYLFYAFLYGAVGALVSKTEDVSKSSSGLMVVIMAVYFFSLLQLTNADGTAIKILSFLPVSSYSTMFARLAMGTVAPWEIAVSLVILAASIVGAGVLGAGIYRMGTLRYGNPIKLSTALRGLKNR